MFRFDFSTLDDRDKNDTIEALHLILTTIEDQQDNAGFQYLIGLISDEATRRNDGEIGGEITVELPFAEMTEAHYWTLANFAGAVVIAASKGEPSAMAQFFARVVDEIERFSQRIVSAVNN